MQDELATLSSDSVHMTAVKADHNVHLDEPPLVVNLVLDWHGTPQGKKKIRNPKSTCIFGFRI